MTSYINDSSDSEGRLPKASIIITVKDEERTIANTIKSVLRIDYPTYEVILVDGGSVDRTISVVKQIEVNPYPLQNRVKIIETKDYSPSQGRNVGIRSSSGNIVAFLDGDCYIARQDWLKSAVALLKLENVGGVGGPTISCSQGTYLSRKLLDVLSTFFASAGSTLFGRLKKQREVKNIPSCNAVYRREALEKAGLYSEDLRFCEDVDLNYKVRKAGYRLIYSPEVIVEHDWKVDSIRSMFHHMIRYGAGRATAGKKYRYLFSPFYAVPSVLLLCLFSLLLLSFTNGLFTRMTGLFLSFYGTLTFIFAILAAYQFKDIKLVLLAPITYVVTHIGYAIGFVLGLTREVYNKAKPLHKWRS